MNPILFMPYKDPEKQREYQREWARKNKEKVNASNRRYKKQNKEKIREHQRNVVKRVKDLLGSKCVYCGCNIYDALEINHINGGGCQESKKISGRLSFYYDILAGRRTTEDLELACRVCNNWHYLTKTKDIPDGWTITWNENI
jgi:hypothetical protein